MPIKEIPPAQPLLVIGAPLGGGQFAARYVRGLGALLGLDANPNGESHFFGDLNRHLLRAAHAEWDTPEPLAWTLADEALVEALADDLRERVSSSKTRGFLGWKSSLRTRSLLALEGEWGWFDPRTTLLLPIWLRVFPRARIVHVSRNGVDVALSLAAREAERRADLRNPARSARCLDARRAFDVWAQYTAAALAHAELAPAERVLHLRYEDLAREPVSHLGRVAGVAGLAPNDELARDVLAGDDAPRPWAFRESETGNELYRALATHPLMRRLEYDDLAKQAS